MTPGDTEVSSPVPGTTVTGCPEPPVPNNAQQIEIFHNSWSNTTHVVYRCMTGYVHKTGALNRTCLEEGTWSGENPICILEPILNGVHIAWIIIGVVGLVVLGLFGQDFLRYRSRKSTSRKNRTSVPRDHPRPLPFYKRKFDNPLAMIYAPNDQQSKSVSKRHQAYLAGTTDAQNGNVLNMGGDHFKKRKGTKKKKVRAQQVGPSYNEADSPVKVSAHKKMRETAENYSQGNVMTENATKHVGFLDSRKMATELSPMNSAVNSYENGEVLKEMPVKKYQRPEFVFPPPTEDIVYTIPVATYPGRPSPRNLPPLSNVRSLPMDGTKYANIDSTYTSSELV